MSGSNFYIKSLLIILCLTMSCSNGANSSCNLKSSGYCIIIDEDPVNIKWSNYLYKELLKRTNDKNILHLKTGKWQCEKIKVEVNKSCKHDYCIVNTSNSLTLTAQNEDIMNWLITQYIKQLSIEDERINDNELPPAIIDFETGKYNFDFEYREPFFSYNIREEHNKILGTNSLDTDWGIWGHNLHKIIDNKDIYSIYATKNGVLKKEQYCFSSEELFRQIKNFIDKDYAGNETKRFMIMPNDNLIACNCDLCKAKGNINNNATPAVSHLIKRLAAVFPQHIFFTSAYLTTNTAPNEKWPSNTGVMISTINLPKGVKLKEEQKEVKEFNETLTAWKKKVNKIYIWDYAANFDDYLTPLPILYGLKNQLQYYSSKGVNGVFLNAGGYDYSPFDDVKSFVTAALMINTELSVDDLCKQFLMQYYPRSGELMTSYYLTVEKKFHAKNKPYNMYGGFNDILKTYLDINDFIAFYQSIEQIKDEANDNEKKELDKLHTALSFCRLQISHTKGTQKYGFAHLHSKELFLSPETKKIYTNLLKYKQYDDLHNYKEQEGDLKNYLSNWENLFSLLPYQNLLINEPIKILSRMDEEYSNATMLNDGIPGFNYDYHMGWHLTSTDDLQVYIDARNLKQTSEITLRFLVHERHRIYSPIKIEVYKNDKIYKTIMPTQKNNYSTPRTDVATISVDFTDADNILLKIYRRENEKGSIACDEIQFK